MDHRLFAILARSSCSASTSSSLARSRVRAVMAEQLDKLIELVGSRRIVLQVLPFTARDHAGVEGPVTVYEFADAPSVAYTECYGGGRIVEDRQEVGDLATVVGLIRSSALSPADSIELIREIRRDHD
jgi:hypothetical protein